MTDQRTPWSRSSNARAEMRLAVAVGRGDATDTSIAVDNPGQLEPGARRTFRIPVHFDPLGFGRHIAAGEVAAPGTVAPFEVSTSIHPWGLYARALVGLDVIAVAGRNRRRRRDRSSTTGGRAVSPNRDSTIPEAVHFGSSRQVGRRSE